MRFHPKSLASSDHRPGPNMASAAAIVAVNRCANGSPSDVTIREISITATAIPANGVHSPATRSSPGPAKDAKVSVARNGESLHSGQLARTRRTQPMTRRMTSKPMPGQPPANVA
jgi:hypothetical protein